MMRKGLSVRFCLVLLTLVCLWRLFGAPVSAQDFEAMPVQWTQARILLPQRIVRVFQLWMMREKPVSAAETETKVLVYRMDQQKMEEMSTADYLRGVLAAEMPAQYHLEALKAQAAAAYTRVLYQQQKGGCALHPGADICTDSAHCQGYASETERKERWQDSFAAYEARLKLAVQETKGCWIAYEGEPITVLYHAISGGQTEDAKNVFAQSVPYLINVESSGEENTRGFQMESSMGYEEAVRLLNGMNPALNITAEELRKTLSVNSYTESGRVSALQVGTHEVSAVDFRKAMRLRSTWFSFVMNDDGITFQQRGYGHGVGMSQAGAHAMAAAGASYQQILLHYYPGVSIVQSPADEKASLGTGYARRDENASKQPLDGFDQAGISAL